MLASPWLAYSIITQAQAWHHSHSQPPAHRSAAKLQRKPTLTLIPRRGKDIKKKKKKEKKA